MSEQIVLPLPLLQFGEIYAHDVTDVISSVAVNDWDQLVAFDTNGESTRGVTPDQANNQIVIERPGVYQIDFTWSGFGPASPHDWDLHAALNNRTTSLNNFTAHFRTPTAQNKQTVSTPGGKVFLNVNDTVELWIQRLSAGNNIDLTTIACTLGVTRIKK